MVILIVVPIQLLFLATLIDILFIEGEEKVQTIISFLFTMGIFSFPLWWGFRLWKASKLKSSAVSLDQDLGVSTTGTEMVVKLQAKVELPDYRRLMFLQTYTTPIFIFIHLIGITFLIFYLTTGTSDSFTLFILFFLVIPSVWHLSKHGFKLQDDENVTRAGDIRVHC